jgi:PBSX family phage terminase large subunit
MSRIKFSRKQLEYFKNATHRFNFKVGAVRSGKSFGDIAHVIAYRIIERRGMRGLNVILGVSKATIERNVLQPMREIYGSHRIGNINNRNVAILFGEEVHCLGAEKVSQVAKIQGASIKYCYGDEIAKWSQDVFEILPSRLDKEYSCMDGACNPEHPMHWLKEFIDREDIDSYVQHYTIFDNPFLPKSFVDNLCTEYEGTVYYQRFILGEWALAEGLIYPSFTDALISDLSAYDGKPTDYALSIDYGTQNAFAALLWAKYGAVWVCIDEYYYSGRDTGAQKTDEEYADDLDRFTKPIMDARKAQAEKDHTYFRKLKTVIDPSAASFIEALERRRNYSVMKADNAVADGIRETYTCMKQGYIKILRSCKSLVAELNGYVWDEKAADDTPLKVNDHAADSLRYFCKTYGLARPRKEYVSPYGRF